MRRFLIFFISIIIIFISNSRLKSQDLEWGIMGGTLHYLGDLTYRHVKLSETKLNYGGVFRFNFNPRLAFKADVFYGNISGADSLKPRVHGAAYGRGLSFKSHLLDVSGQFEFNITPFVSGNRLRFWAPYILAGLSVYNYNPKAYYNGQWYELQPLGTEGQGLPYPEYGAKYKLTQFSIPYGIGIKYSFKRPRNRKQINLYLWNIALEVSQRKTFNDHLDDVGGKYPDFSLLPGGANGLVAHLSDRQGAYPGSQKKPGMLRGNPEEYDAYMFFGFTITKTLRKNTCFSF